jgi:hypothetical protein
MMVRVERWMAWEKSVGSVERLDGGVFGLGSSARLRVKGAPASVLR